MGFYKSINSILRHNAFNNITKQIKHNPLRSIIAPRKDLLPANISSYLFLERLTIRRSLHTCQNLSKKCTVEEVQQLADVILKENHLYEDTSKKEELVKILEFLISHGCKIKDIKKKCLSFLKPSNSSYVKVLQISELGSDILELIPFMNLSLISLRKAALQAKEDKHAIASFPNRISYLSHHLETPVEELIPALAKHSSMLTMPFSRLNHKINVLKSADIRPEDLVKDLWIFNYNEKLLADRIFAAEKAGVKLKPWMLRCSNKFFTSKLKKDTETQRILKGNDVVQYLSKQLDCKEEYVKYLMERNKLLENINIPKIEQHIHFLYEKGYTPQEIRLFPRVFCFKIETLSKRFEEYQKFRSTLPSIPQLCLASKEFQNNIKKYQESG